VPAALEFRRAHEWEAVVASCRERLERTISALEARIRGVPTAALVLRAPQLAAVFIDLGGREPVDVQRQLWEQFRIEVPLDRVGDRSVVRVSVQAYTTDEDCEALIAALETIL
jgi:selenocysteine lyase/cysteine desulfurase